MNRRKLYISTIAAIMEALLPGEHKNRYPWQSAPSHGYRPIP